MNSTLKNIVAVILGWVGGSIVNMGLVYMGHSVFPIEGVDPNDMKAMAQAMPGLESKYFIFPFLAHAVGTFVGAFIAALLAATHKLKIALVIGILFFIGGIAVSFMIPGPTWFTALDLIVAYIPMAWLGGKLGSRKKS